MRRRSASCACTSRARDAASSSACALDLRQLRHEQLVLTSGHDAEGGVTPERAERLTVALGQGAIAPGSALEHADVLACPA